MFISPEQNTGLSSPFLDVMSDLQDSASVDTVRALSSLLDQVPQTHWRSVAAALARLTTIQGVVKEQYKYIPRDARGKQQISVKPLTHNATIGQALVAVRGHALKDISEVAEGWAHGRNASVSALGGGFPIPDPNADANDVMEDFLKNLKHAVVIGGQSNPVSPHLVDTVKTNFIAIQKTKPDTRAENLKKFSSGFLPLVGERVTAAVSQFMAFPANVRDNFNLSDDRERSLFTAEVLKQRGMAREALKHGRASRGEDNVPFLTTPYYRIRGALKSVNRLAYVLAATEGKIATTTSTQLSQAFGATDGGWHVYMDNEVSFEQLMTKLAVAKHIENNVLADKVLVQVNVLEEDAKTSPQKLFNFLIANSVSFGWAIHDGRVFVSRKDGAFKCAQYPKMFAMISAVNWVRTLQSHVPTVEFNLDLGRWFGTMPNVAVPVGSFTGHTVQLEFGNVPKVSRIE